MQNQLHSVHIKGFRSFADVQITNLPKVAVLLGASGSGKTNFIRFFDMLSWMLRVHRLGEFIQRQGGADDQLFGGGDATPSMDATVTIKAGERHNDYQFTLARAPANRFVFAGEAFRFSRGQPTDSDWRNLGSGHSEAKIVEAAQSHNPDGHNQKTTQILLKLLRGSATYHFRDTSDGSHIKKTWEVEDNAYLRTQGENLASVLLRLEREDRQRFERICRQIGEALPLFDRFQIEESCGRAALRWKAKGSDKTFGAHVTADGTLRFFALTTLLNFPPDRLLDVIFLDEPELGLHPAALALVGNMIQALGRFRQVIVATQSPLLVDALDLDEIIVLEPQDGETKARQLDADEYQRWLQEQATPSSDSNGQRCGG